MTGLALQTRSMEMEETDEITRWLQVDSTGVSRRDSTLEL